MRAALLTSLALRLMAGDRSVYVQHKAAHAAIGMAVYEVGKASGHPKTGLALAFGLGIGKELYDRKHGGSFRAGDVAWTTVPATISFSFKW